MTRRFLVSAVAGIVCLLGTTGCTGDNTVYLDANYLRENDKLSTSAEKTTFPELFPSRAGMRYEYRVLTRDEGVTTETISNVGTKPRDTGTEFVREMRRGGKLLRRERYFVGASGIYYVAAGTTTELRLNPPMPVIVLPLQEGSSTEWDGEVVDEKGRSTPASAFSRFSYKEKIKTPAGTFEAIRVDTNLIALLNGAEVQFPATRWLVPGIGVVREQFLADGKLVIKELVKRPGS